MDPDNMATYLAMGLRFNKSVFKEICQILRDFDTVAAIIPVYEEEYGVPHHPIFSSIRGTGARHYPM